MLPLLVTDAILGMTPLEFFFTVIVVIVIIAVLAWALRKFGII